MHQGVGLEVFNAWPERKAVHALYECTNSYTLARELARGREYDDHDTLFRRLDALLFALSEADVDQILDACPDIGRRPRSAKSQAEHCSVWDDDPELMAELGTASHSYADKYGFAFVMFVDGHCANEVLAAVGDRMHHDADMERKVLRNELAKIGRSRLERMLGPEGGFHNW
ncbi:2-oxo-4-hydroxy-4-carboxy-5-ureidoimidazoline decarboxylase [Mycobacterium sp. C31M]